MVQISYSNDQTQIRAGMVNFIGSLLKTSNFDGKVGRQNVNAILVEEILKLSTEEDGTKELYSLRPLFKGCANTLVSLCSKLQNDTSKEAKEKLEEYKSLLIALDGFIKNNLD